MRSGSWIFCLTLVAACGQDATSAGGGDASSLAASSSSSSGGSSGSSSSSSGSGGDGGANDADAAPAEPTCERAKASSAPLSIFSTFIADPSSSKRTAFLADLAARGGTPFESRDSDAVTFIALGDPPSGPWKVSGSWIGWSTENALAMTKVDGTTDVWRVDATIPRGTSFEYKLLSGTQWLEDPLAGTVVWDGIDRGFGVKGELNAVGHAAALPMTRGRMNPIRRMHATKLNDDRDVWVYRPAAYDSMDCTKKVPSIIFHDGLESLTRGAFAKVADELYAEKPELAAALIFVGLPSQDVRMAQYTFASDGAKGADYVDFLTTDLWPRISKDTRICKSPLARGISGASLGGLISSYAAFEKPDQWGWVGAQSASYFWADNAMISRVQNEPTKKPVRFYLDSGCPDDNCDVTDQMDAALTAKGYEHVRIKQNGATHDWSFWRDRLRGLLTHFRENQTACD